MPENIHKNFLFDFLTESKFRILRHMLFVTILVSVSLGQSFFVFREGVDILGSKIYLFGVFLVISYVVFAYYNLYSLVPRFLLKNKYSIYFITLLAYITILLIIKYFAEYWIFSSLGFKKHLNGVLALDLLSTLTLNVICIASSPVTVLFKQWITDTKHISDLENKRLRSSIDEIKNHIHPKFLFDTINQASIRVKIEPKKTSDMLFQLSELLRYELYDCKRDKVVLKSDIDFIENYLSLEQQNAVNNFTYSVTVNGNVRQFIYPFIFMSFVQQIVEQNPDSLSIYFNIEGDKIEFKCTVIGINLTKCDFSKVEQRLKVLYNDNFEIDRNKEFVRLQLKHAK